MPLTDQRVCDWSKVHKVSLNTWHCTFIVPEPLLKAFTEEYHWYFVTLQTP